MDIPITLRFFEKLNLYQEIKKRNKKPLREWESEKCVLSWGANPERHAHLHTPLIVQRVLSTPDEIIGPMTEEGEVDRTRYVRVIFGNLVMRGLAQWRDSTGAEDGIRFTRDGLLVGEILNDIRDHPRREGRYKFLYILSWVIFGALAISAVGEGLKMLWELVCFVATFFGCLCH